MAFPIHSILRQPAAVTADGDEVFDLPVNPLSLMFLNLLPLNNTGTISDYQAMQGLLSAVDNIQVTWRGASILNLSGQDMAAYLMWASMIGFQVTNLRETDDERRSLVIPLIFGRTPYAADECLPATKKGELEANITWDIADTGFDGLQRSVETVELPGANPTHFQRLVTISQTFAATGINDVDLSIGNIVRGILLFGTTGWTGAVPASTIGRLSLLLNNIETWYSSTDWEVSRAASAALGYRVPPYLDHIHGINAAGAGQEDTQAQQIEAALLANYTYLELDPTHNDLHSIDTRGASRFHLRITADAANAMRAIPVEKVLVTDFFRNA